MERDSVQDRPPGVEMPPLLRGPHRLLIAGVVILLLVVAGAGYAQYQHAQAVAAFDQGTAYVAQGDLNRAIASFDQAVGFKPDYAAAYYGRGQVYQAKGAYDAAIADYTLAIQFQPDLAGAYTRRGAAYAATRRV